MNTPTNIGWICLYRQIMDSEDYFGERFDRTHAWIDLLLLASTRSRTFRKRGILVTLQEGDVALSVRDLAKRWQWSVNTVQAYLKQLESDTQLAIVRSHTINIIRIVNWAKYQQYDTPTDTQTDTQIDTQTDTQPNNVNKETSKKETPNGVKKATPRFERPKNEEVQAYIAEKGFTFRAEAFCDFYDSKNWYVGRNKMKDWKAAVRNWARNERHYPARQTSSYQTTIKNANDEWN